MTDTSIKLIILAIIIIILVLIVVVGGGSFGKMTPWRPDPGSGDTDVFVKPGSGQGETGLMEPPPPTVIPEYDTIIMVTILCGIIGVFIVAKRYQSS